MQEKRTMHESKVQISAGITTKCTKGCNMRQSEKNP